MPRMVINQNGIQIRSKVYVQGKALRVTIPKDIWKQLGEPSEFIIDVKDGKIVLIPVKE